jgi:iron complex transport system substrate-binding protein
MRWLALVLLSLLPLLAPLLIPRAMAGDVVSLNLCTDQYLLLLAPERAAAVTFLARDPSLSVVVAQAARLPAIRADAETVLRMAPSLVLASPWSAAGTISLLERRGIRVARFALMESFDGVRAQTREIAALLGKPAAGEAMLAEMERHLKHPRATPLRAMALAPRGYSAGPGSFTDAVMTAAGLRNAGSGGSVSLEDILAHPPDLLVVARDRSMPSLATDFLRHPALADIPRRFVTPALLACAGPWSAAAVAELAP